MPLTPDAAADIARDAGLGVADAVALRALTDDTDTATRIAAKWTESDETRAARALFRTDDHGAAVEPARGTDDPERAFVRDLFGRTDTTDTQE